MKIIIDISEAEYEDIKYFGTIVDESRDYIASSILNGTPLPKGHGRLIDVKQIVTEDECIWNSDGSCTTITTYDIDSTPTIIEADKAESEKV